MISLSENARKLILEFEGLDQPARWPGSDSGITLGHGFDLGYATRAQFMEAWERHFDNATEARLITALGKKGLDAKAMAPRFKDIIITPAKADEVFARCTIPRWLALTEQALPGIDKLPPDAQGALVSLCFNRGTAMTGPRREGMRKVRAAVAAHVTGTIPLSAALQKISAAVDAMQALWPTVPGLQRRRRAEADMIRRAA